MYTLPTPCGGITLQGFPVSKNIKTYSIKKYKTTPTLFFIYLTINVSVCVWGGGQLSVRVNKVLYVKEPCCICLCLNLFSRKLCVYQAQINFVFHSLSQPKKNVVFVSVHLRASSETVWCGLLTSHFCLYIERMKICGDKSRA